MASNSHLAPLVLKPDAIWLAKCIMKPGCVPSAKRSTQPTLVPVELRGFLKDVTCFDALTLFALTAAIHALSLASICSGALAAFVDFQS
jgi:hypothetical protein